MQAAMSGLQIEVRRGGEGDLAAVGRVQAGSPEAAQWDVREYLEYDLSVALCDGQVAGFAVSRRLAEGESELLNLAVDGAFRRRGIGRRLIQALTAGYGGALWLEVRESNSVARNFYKSLGFCETGRRRDYYSDSSESAIVMNVHS
jgi:ribosomal-protein-alanine N-acetyltransferase